MHYSTHRLPGVGQILDRSFQVYRKLFSPLFLLTLIAFGPVYLLSNVLLVNLEALPLVPEFRFESMEDFWASRFPDHFFSGGPAVWVKVTGVILLLLIVLFFILPMYFAAGVIMTNQALDGRAPAVGEALRQAWGKYGRVLGNSVLFALITTGAYLGVSVVNSILTFIYGAALGSTAALAGSEAAMTAAGAGFLIIYLIVTYAGTLVYYYFMIRFGFFLPPLLFEDASIGIGRSWTLTRRSFWRLLAVYLIYGSLSYVFLIAFAGVFTIFGATLSGLLLALLAFCALVPAGLVTYTFAYRVLQIRVDSPDLEELLARLKGLPAEEPGGTGA